MALLGDVHVYFSSVFHWRTLPFTLFLFRSCRRYAMSPMVAAREVINRALDFASALPWHEHILPDSSESSAIRAAPQLVIVPALCADFE